MEQCRATTKSGARCRRLGGEDSGLCAQHARTAVEEPSGPLEGIASSGDRVRTLTELRQVLARAIDAGPSPRDLAALTRRLQLVLAELQELGAEVEEQSASDELARRRAARLAGASS